MLDLLEELLHALLGGLRRVFLRRRTAAELRRRIMRHFAEAEAAPLPDDVGMTQRDFRTLARKRALVLDGQGQIVIANPFSGVPTDFVVEANGSSWYANCAWDGLGILAALARDGSLRTWCSDCEANVEVTVRGGRVSGEGLVAHFLVPAARWHDHLAYT